MRNFVWDIETGPIGEDADGAGALSPLSGRILAIGLLDQAGTARIWGDDDEKLMLEGFMNEVRSLKTDSMIGFNSDGFDVPFVARRAWMLGVDPMLVHFFVECRNHIDLMRQWMFNDEKRISLARLGDELGIEQGKFGHGKDFAGWWHDPAMRDRAIQYMVDDLCLTARCASRMVMDCQFKLEGILIEWQH